jgi:hypothetical protein
MQEAVSETFDGLADARDFGDVYAGAEDHLGIVRLQALGFRLQRDRIVVSGQWSVTSFSFQKRVGMR